MKNLFLILLLASFFQVKSQTQQKFDAYGELMINQLSHSRFDSLPLMRIRELRDFLKERISNERKLTAETYKMDAGYLDRYRKYQQNMFSLIKSFEKAKKNGATFKFNEIFVEPLNGLKDTYRAELIYIYTQGKVQNEVSLSFDFAWYLETIVLLGSVKEDF